MPDIFVWNYNGCLMFATEKAPLLRLLKFNELSIESIARFAFILTCAAGTIALWMHAALPMRVKKAAAAAGIVHFLCSPILDLLAVHFGVYRYVLMRELLWGVPFDLHLGWAALWGTGLCLAWMDVRREWRIPFVAGVIGVTLAFDFCALRSGRVFEPLRGDWWVWDLGGLTILASIALTFFKLARENRGLWLRAGVYALAYLAVFYVWNPAMILTLGEGRAFNPLALLKPWGWCALALAALPGGMAAVQFAASGKGTPLPLDPTRELVTGGVYAHVRNPMQISAVLSSVVWALSAESVLLWIYVADLIVLLALIKRFEEWELLERFGTEYERYSAEVKKWIPRLTPYRAQPRAGLAPSDDADAVSRD